MKALITYGSYGCKVLLCEVKLDSDNPDYKNYLRKDEAFTVVKKFSKYEFTSKELDDVLGTERNYLSDSCGFVPYLQDSHITELSEKQFQLLIDISKSDENDDYFDALLLEYKKNSIDKRTLMINDLISRCENSKDYESQQRRYDKAINIIENISKVQKEIAKETNTKVLVTRKLLPCNDRTIECSNDIYEEYRLPDGTLEKIRTHTY